MLGNPDQPAFAVPSGSGDDTGGLLVLIDASNEVERMLLRAWVTRSDGPGAGAIGVVRRTGLERLGITP